MGIPFGQTIGAAILSFIVEGVAVATAPAWVPAALGAGALVALGYTSYKVYDRYFAVNQINVDEENEKLIEEKEKRKKENHYAPDRELPRDKYGKPIPDVDTEHTQLGHREGKKTGKYPQAREFDKDGKPVRDIDFTDHGYPELHPNPHQHKYLENETGGTRKRSTKPEGL